MPARIVVVHDDPIFRDEMVTALQRAGHDVLGFSNSMPAIDALEAAQRIEILITRVRFPEGTPHGIALARMARAKRPGSVKVLFVVDPDMAEHTEGVGEVLVMPVTSDEVVAKVREMLEDG